MFVGSGNGRAPSRVKPDFALHNLGSHGQPILDLEPQDLTVFQVFALLDEFAPARVKIRHDAFFRPKLLSLGISMHADISLA